MVKFLLYLFESGLCLSIFLLAYFLFFRKETYFRFNRFYLLSIMFLSLLVPFMHLNISISNTQRYEHAINNIGKFRTYYEQLIAMTDPEFYNAQQNTDNGFNEFNYTTYLPDDELKSNTNQNFQTDNQIEQKKSKHRISIASIIFMVYILGVLIFLGRIIVLFHWLFKTIRKSQVHYIDGVQVIYMDDKLPPFSFLGYAFLNKELISNQSEEIVAHEKAHINQMHSFDLLLAHSLSIFQWFNPFVWFLQKAIKTNHEYLADSNVVNNGYSLFDYQELLLNQFISIPSVQLVNNFNLISIKNRINMMNKIKSGFAAKFKALLVIPTALFAFILFANLTLKSPGKVLTNISFFETQSNLNQLKGMWVNTSTSTYGTKVLVENSKFSVLDDNLQLKEYPYQLNGNQIVLNLPHNETAEIKYELTNDNLKLWWNDTEYSQYKKSEYDNSLDQYLASIDEEITLPVLENYWLIQRLDLCIEVAMIKDKIYVNKQPATYNTLKEHLLTEHSKINLLDQPLTTILIYADKDLSMQNIHLLKQTLREIGLLKVAHMGKAADHKVSELQTAYVGMPQKLPPLEGLDILDKKNLDKKGITLIEIDATNEENTPENVKPKFKEAVQNAEKYVADLYYDKSTILNTYLGYQDMARSVIYEFRRNYTQEKYTMKYDDLSSVQQREIKKKYPLIISEASSFKP